MGVLQLDRRGRIMADNDRARALLRKRDGLWDEDGHLRAALPEEDATLRSLLARALPVVRRPGMGSSMRVSRQGPLPQLMLHVSPVNDAAADLGKSRIGALVLAVDPADRMRIDPERVREALGLTQAESQIAVLLAQGMTIDEVAVRTGRKRTTVKWHIQHIYAKHGLSRQVELVHLVIPLAEVPGVQC